MKEIRPASVSLVQSYDAVTHTHTRTRTHTHTHSYTPPWSNLRMLSHTHTHTDTHTHTHTHTRTHTDKWGGVPDLELDLPCDWKHVQFFCPLRPPFWLHR